MAGILESLAMGLRQAGGVLNPAVQGILANESSQDQAFNNNVQMTRLNDALARQRELASPEYQMRVEQLNNERGFRGAMVEAGGDMTKVAQAAMRFGKPEVAMKIYEGAEARKARLDEAQARAEGRLQELEMRLQDQALNRELRAQIAQQADETRRFLGGISAQNASLGNQIRLMGVELGRDRLNADIERRDRELREKGVKDLDKRVQGLGTALEKAGLPNIDSVMGEVESYLKDKPQLISYITGPQSVLPDMAIPQEGRDARAAFQRLFNITLKDRSGAAVTNQELERLKQEFATGVLKDPNTLMNAAAKARGIINNHYASVASSFGPEALRAYNENIKEVGGRVVVTPRTKPAAASVPPPPPGFVVNQ